MAHLTVKSDHELLQYGYYEFMAHMYDKRYEAVSFTAGQQYHCLCHNELQIPRPVVTVQESAYDVAKEYLASLCRKVGIYFCPSCKEPDSEPDRHAKLHPECVQEIACAAKQGVN